MERNGQPRPVELLGDVNAVMGRYEQASEHYEALVVLDDQSPRVLYKLALAYYRNGQVEKAIVQVLRRARRRACATARARRSVRSRAV